MRGLSKGAAGAALLAVALLAPAPRAAAVEPAGGRPAAQGAAGRAACDGVQRALASGQDASLVVRTAVEMGHNPCQVLRCALAGGCGGDEPETLEQAIRGAAAAGVPEDVIARCAGEACDPGAVAALLAGILLEPNYCYFSPRPPGGGAALPPPRPVVDRSSPPAQVSPISF
jgi:hypothetical protein